MLNVPCEFFLNIWRRHHYGDGLHIFYLHSELMAMEQWTFFSVPHLPRQGAFIYNGDFRGLVVLTPAAERLAVKLSLPVFTTYVCRAGIRTCNLPLRSERSNRLHHRDGYAERIFGRVLNFKLEVPSPFQFSLGSLFAYFYISCFPWHKKFKVTKWLRKGRFISITYVNVKITRVIDMLLIKAGWQIIWYSLLNNY